MCMFSFGVLYERQLFVLNELHLMSYYALLQINVSKTAAVVL